MNPWLFIAASYALTIVAVTALALWSWGAMRRAEAEAARLSERP
jgi:hypothetical protein